MLYTTLVHALPTLLEKVGLKRPLSVSNLLFSNPFGFEGKCYLMGAEVELALPMSVVAAGQMLNVTVVTLGDTLQIGFLGIPGAIDRIDELARHTQRCLRCAEARTQRTGAAERARRQVCGQAHPEAADQAHPQDTNQAHRTQPRRCLNPPCANPCSTSCCVGWSSRCGGARRRSSCCANVRR